MPDISWNQLKTQYPALTEEVYNCYREMRTLDLLQQQLTQNSSDGFDKIKKCYTEYKTHYEACKRAKIAYEALRDKKRQKENEEQLCTPFIRQQQAYHQLLLAKGDLLIEQVIAVDKSHTQDLYSMKNKAQQLYATRAQTEYSIPLQELEEQGQKNTKGIQKYINYIRNVLANTSPPQVAVEVSEATPAREEPTTQIIFSSQPPTQTMPPTPRKNSDIYRGIEDQQVVTESKNFGLLLIVSVEEGYQGYEQHMEQMQHDIVRYAHMEDEVALQEIDRLQKEAAHQRTLKQKDPKKYTTPIPTNEEIMTDVRNKQALYKGMKYSYNDSTKEHIFTDESTGPDLNPAKLQNHGDHLAISSTTPPSERKILLMARVLMQATGGTTPITIKGTNPNRGLDPVTALKIYQAIRLMNGQARFDDKTLQRIKKSRYNKVWIAFNNMSERMDFAKIAVCLKTGTNLLKKQKAINIKPHSENPSSSPPNTPANQNTSRNSFTP